MLFVADDSPTDWHRCRRHRRRGRRSGTADDGVVAAAGVDDVIASAGLDGVVAGAGGDVVVAAAGGDVIVAVADGNVDGIIGARDGKVVVLRPSR